MQEEKAEVGSSEVDESTLHSAYSPEDARVHHLQWASIDLNELGCGITTAFSAGGGWPATAADRSLGPVINT